MPIRSRIGLVVGIAFVCSILATLPLLGRAGMAASGDAHDDEPPPPAAITLTLPITLEVGGAVAPLEAFVADAGGRPVADGTEVLLDTTLGQLADEKPSTVAGKVTSTLASGPVAGVAVVSARAGQARREGQVTFLAGPARSVAVEIAGRPEVGQALEVDVDVADEYGNAVRDGTPVSLVASRGRVVPSVASTLEGRATASWSTTIAGLATVTATAGAAMASSGVFFEPGAAELMTLTVESPVIAVEDGSTRLRATVTDRYGNIPLGAPAVRFTGDGGEIEPSTVAVVDGLATSRYQAGRLPGRFELRSRAGRIEAEAKVDVRGADLSLTESELDGPRGPVSEVQVHPGERLTYTVAVASRSIATAREVVLGVELPDRLRVDEISMTKEVDLLDEPPPELLGSPTAGREQLAWQLPDLALGEGLTLTVAGDTDPDEPWTGFDSLFYRAAVTTTTAVQTTGRLDISNTASLYSADLYITKELDPDASSLRAGGHLVYEISFGNLQGQTELSTVTITDTLPELTTFDHWQPNTGTVIRPAGPLGPESRDLVWEVEAPFGISPGFRLWLNIDSAAAPDSVLTNRISIGSPIHEVRTANNRFTDSVQLRGVNLVAALDGPQTIAPGEELLYGATVRNASRLDAAHQVEVVSSLPAGMEVLRTDPIGLVMYDGRVRWQFELLSPGAQRRFEILARAPETAAVGGYLKNRLEVTSQDLEIYSSDNAAEVWTRVVPGAPARVTVTPARRELVACSGDSTTVEAVIADRVGNPVADGTSATWSSTAGLLGQEVSSTVNGRAQAVLAAGRRPGVASITARSGEALGSADVSIVPGPPVSLAASADPNTARRGGRVLVVVNVLDRCANQVADGWPIRLTAERGRFASGSRTIEAETIDGRVGATLWVGDEPGPLRVVAQHEAISGEVQISVEARSVFELFFPYALR